MPHIRLGHDIVMGYVRPGPNMIRGETNLIHKLSDFYISLQLLMAQYQLHLSLFTLYLMD